MSKHKLDFIFVLVFFSVFAASVLLTLTLGGVIYKSMSERIQDSYDDRTGLSYIWSKVKNYEGAGLLYTGDFYNLSMLCLEEEHDMVKYVTRIYLYDGWIRELVSNEGHDFSPEEGMPVLAADTLSFVQLENGLIKATINENVLCLFPRVKANA